MNDVYYYLFVGSFLYLLYGYYRMGSVQIYIEKECFVSYFKGKSLQYMITNTPVK